MIAEDFRLCWLGTLNTVQISVIIHNTCLKIVWINLKVGESRQKKTEDQYCTFSGYHKPSSTTCLKAMQCIIEVNPM